MAHEPGHIEGYDPDNPLGLSRSNKFKIDPPININTWRKKSRLLTGTIPSLTDFAKESVRSDLGQAHLKLQTAEGTQDLNVEKTQESRKNIVDEVYDAATSGEQHASDDQFFKGLKHAIATTVDPGRKAKLEFRLAKFRKKAEKKRKKFEEKAAKKAGEGKEEFKNVITDRASTQQEHQEKIKQEQQNLIEDMPIVDREKDTQDYTKSSGFLKSQQKIQEGMQRLKEYDPESSLLKAHKERFGSRPLFKTGGISSLSTSAKQDADESKMQDVSGVSSAGLDPTQNDPSSPFSDLSSGYDKLSEEEFLKDQTLPEGMDLDEFLANKITPMTPRKLSDLSKPPALRNIRGDLISNPPKAEEKGSAYSGKVHFDKDLEGLLKRKK